MWLFDHLVAEPDGPDRDHRRIAPGRRPATAGIQFKTAAVAAPAASLDAAPRPGGDLPAVDPFDFSFQSLPAEPGPDAVMAAAQLGTRGAAAPLPHLDAIQRAFGHHDVTGIEAHAGPEASLAAQAMGAQAYATGNQVAFDGTPSLHTAAHEATHVLQQRAGVQLKGGIGEDGDPYERQADAVADRVVRGESAQDLLDQIAPGTAAPGPRPIQRKKGKWLLCGLLAVGGLAAVIGGIVTGMVPLAIAGGLAIVGAIAVGTSARKDDQRDKTIEQFGNKHRDREIDPDGPVHEGAPRPDDAPIVPEFRVAFNQLENWKIVVKTKHPELTEEFNQKFFPEEAEDFGGQVKTATKAYKEQYRNLAKDPEQVTQAYRETITQIQKQIEDLTGEITAWYLEKTGKRQGVDEEQGMLDPQSKQVNEQVHTEGTALWRKKWEQAILTVNTTLAGLWPTGKASLQQWVNTEKTKEANAAADMTGAIGELDYIGSLAKGVKGPPKQHIRFNPDDFDVDANLKAPPLSNYAMAIKGKIPDRQRIFGRASEIPPLIEFADRVQEALLQIPGIQPDEHDQFDVALEAADTPVQTATNEANTRLWKLRRDRPEDFARAVQALGGEHLLTGDVDNYKLAPDCDLVRAKAIIEEHHG